VSSSIALAQDFSAVDQLECYLSVISEVSELSYSSHPRYMVLKASAQTYQQLPVVTHGPDALRMGQATTEPIEGEHWRRTFWRQTVYDVPQMIFLSF